MKIVYVNVINWFIIKNGYIQYNLDFEKFNEKSLKKEFIEKLLNLIIRYKFKYKLLIIVYWYLWKRDC